MKDSKLKRMILKYWFSFQQFNQLHYVRKHYGLKIMSSKETILYIKKNNCSVARYGDGEFEIMLQKGAPVFQNGSQELANAMSRVFENNTNKLLICLPRSLVSTEGFEPWAKNFWHNWAINHQAEVVEHIYQYVGKNYCFGDAYVSRPFTAYKSRKYSQKIFSLLKELWNERDILIVEGKQTRLGVGNDLFHNAKSVKRILGPAENAFDSYNALINAVCAYWSGELIVLALGPTATILASDLSVKGMQALDLGHIDIQYEWYLRNDKSFKPIPGKYTNEAVGGNNAGDCIDGIYLSQIITVID